MLKMKKYRLKDKYLVMIAKTIAITSIAGLLYVTFYDLDITERLNECMKTHSFEYCNYTVK